MSTDDYDDPLAPSRGCAYAMLINAGGIVLVYLIYHAVCWWFNL